MSGRPRYVGVPWYRKTDYPRVLRVMEDAQAMPPNYEQWLRRAQDAMSLAEDLGAIPIKAVLSPETFVTWCRAQGLKPNFEARRRFANEVARREASVAFH